MTKCSTPRRAPAAWLAWLLAGAAAATQAAPFDVEVLVFTRRGDDSVPRGPATVDNGPACVSRAVAPRPADAAPQMPFSLPETQRRLASEAATLGRRGSGLQVLLHGAWRQEVGAERGGTWIRLDAPGLEGCLRVGGEPTPKAEWDIAYLRGPAEGYHVEGSRRLLPGDIHYMDHPAFGMLVRLDPVAVEPAPGDAPTDPAAGRLPTPVDAPPGSPAVSPPPPKKPFRW
jgi:hypothetical protein